MCVYSLPATNKNLATEVENGRFRQDLYYRLRVIELKIPPMRERTEDILALANHFAESIVQHTSRDSVTFSPEAIKHMMVYNWPGNVRELRNSVEYALALASSNRIELHDLPEELQTPAPFHENTASRTLAAVEWEHILKVLETTHGNEAQAAKILGIGIATLYRKLKHFENMADHRY